MNKRGQVTIFIIIGVIVVSVGVLFFLFRTGVVPGIGEKAEKDPNAFLESCMEDKIKEAINLISMQGGYIKNPLYVTFKFEDESPLNISYLCYNQNEFSLCINQEPMLIQHLKKEIYNYIDDDVDNCFKKLILSLEKQGYDVDSSYRDFEIDLTEGKVVIDIDADITLTKTDETSKQKDFKIITPSKFYDLVLIAQKIINAESISGEFDYNQILIYPEANIDKYVTLDFSRIYKIEHKESKEKFIFAVRSMATRPGWFEI